MSKVHYGYGSGMIGCLYDNGPHYGGTDKREAAKAALSIFEDDLTEEETEKAVSDLVACGAHYFPRDVRGKIGADVVEIFEADPEDWADEIEGGVK